MYTEKIIVVEPFKARLIDISTTGEKPFYMVYHYIGENIDQRIFLGKVVADYFIQSEPKAFAIADWEKLVTLLKQCTTETV